MRTLVMGDIHGGYKALRQCLERSEFDFKNDRLIQLGDITDGYPDVYECVEELLKIENLIAVKGNHDDWFAEFIRNEFHPYYWTYGGKGTLVSYLNNCGKTGRFFATGSGYKTALVADDIPQTHKDLFRDQILYYIDDKKRCFLHAGFKRDSPFKSQTIAEYCWDRQLWNDALKYSSDAELKKEFHIKTKFKEIYIGHTRTPKDKPLKLFNIVNMDTGAGHNGKLTIMDIDKKVFWQSDPLSELYPENFPDE
ncbi:metallophosphoesterase [Pedobacter jeongneungensis]|uniref:metallophosphoesterase n=1 Tax=Pedobacter jeongneungensis TaxID=947309 RepID=UPI00046A353D|nr:metallophosphoesterase [Pedobacter jeongneungensis]